MELLNKLKHGVLKIMNFQALRVNTIPLAINIGKDIQLLLSFQFQFQLLL